MNICQLCDNPVKRRHRITHKNYGDYLICFDCLLKARHNTTPGFRKLLHGLYKPQLKFQVIGFDPHGDKND